MGRSILLLLCMLCTLFVFALTLENETDNEKSKAVDHNAASEVKIEVISKLPECEGTLGIADIGVFEADIWYEVGDRKENSMKNGQKRKPYTIQMGKKMILPSIEENIIGMCIGEQRRIIVPPKLAYGNRTIKFPDGRNLSGGATVISEIKLLQIIRNDEETRKTNFGIMDTDGNGFIDKEELKSLILLSLSMMKDKDVTDVDSVVTSIVNILDKDGDHVLTMEEFFDAKTSKVNGEPGMEYFESLLKKFVNNWPNKPKSCPACSKCPPKKPCQTKPTCSTRSKESNTITSDVKHETTGNTNGELQSASRKEDNTENFETERAETSPSTNKKTKDEL